MEEMRNTHPDELAPQLTRDALVSELALQSRGGPNVERPTAAMFSALLASEHSAIQSLIDDATERARARNITRGPAVSALRTTLVDYFRHRSEAQGETFSDAKWVTPADWEKPIAMLADDLQSDESNQKAVDSIYAGLYFREAATPVKERYASIAAMTQLTRERFPTGARGLSIGCSVMAGELQLMHNAEFPMSFKEVRDCNLEDVTPQANQIVGRTTPFRELVGVDINLLYDEDHQRYDEGNAHFALSGLRPSERNDPRYFGELRSLMAKKHKGEPGYTPQSGVTFHRGNLLEAAELEEFTGEFPEPFDIIMMNFLTQELSPADQIRLHEVATQLVSKNGLIMYNHQAYIPPLLQGQPTGIREVHHYGSYATTKFTSAMHYMDMLNPVRGLQEAMRFHNNRCQIARINKVAKLMVDEKLEPLSDLLAHG